MNLYGVDIRCEVALLTRNIQILGAGLEKNLTESLDGLPNPDLISDVACTILNNDAVEKGPTGLVFRKASAIFDHVEIFNCS